VPTVFRIDPSRRLVVSRAWGAVTAAELRAHYRQLVVDPAFDPTYRQLTDVREVTDFELPSSLLADVAAHPVFAPGTRRAFVVSGPVAYGLARMFGAYAEGARQEVQVFRDLAAAEAWLA
jgi:hypothetical protein